MDDPSQDSLFEKEKIFSWARGLSSINPKEWKAKSIRYRPEFEEKDNEIVFLKDEGYKYRKTIIDQMKKAIKLINNTIILNKKK